MAVPYFGAHTSIAGGIHLAFDRMEKIEGKALQIFTANQRQWRSGEISAERIEIYKSRWRESGKPPVAAHDNYLINLAASDERVLLSSRLPLFAKNLNGVKRSGYPILSCTRARTGGRAWSADSFGW